MVQAGAKIINAPPNEVGFTCNVSQPFLKRKAQQIGMCSGTMNVPEIAALGCTVEIAEREMESKGQRLYELRDLLPTMLQDEISAVQLNVDPAAGSPSISASPFSVWRPFVACGALARRSIFDGYNLLDSQS